jgi:hypothetical protein
LLVSTRASSKKKAPREKCILRQAFSDSFF